MTQGSDYDEATLAAAREALDEWLFRIHGLTSSCRHDDEAKGLLDAVAPLIAARALNNLADEWGSLEKPGLLPEKGRPVGGVDRG